MGIAIGCAVSPVFGGGKPADTISGVLTPYGLTGWWDLAQEVTLNGSTVQSIGNAASADANHTLSQGTAADQLLFVASGTPAGKPSMRFVDSSEFMTTVSAPLTFVTVGAHTIWVVVKIASAITGAPQVFGDASARVSLQMNSTGPALNPLNYDGNFDFTTHAVALGSWHVMEWRHESGTLYSRMDGAGEQSAVSGNLASLGATMRVRPAAAGTLNNAEIAEIIVCNQAAPVAARDTINTILRAKHGI